MQSARHHHGQIREKTTAAYCLSYTHRDLQDSLDRPYSNHTQHYIRTKHVRTIRTNTQIICTPLHTYQGGFTCSLYQNIKKSHLSFCKFDFSFFCS